jgi:hypothetical protein
MKMAVVKNNDILREGIRLIPGDSSSECEKQDGLIPIGDPR